MRKFLYATLCLCVTVLLACNPDEKENTSPDTPDVENPIDPDNPDTPDIPDEPGPDIPDEDGGNSGTPDEGGANEPADYTEEARVIYERDFTKADVNLSAYQMIDVDGVDVSNAYYKSGWQLWSAGSGTSSVNLLSHMDSAHEHDHWLITEGFYLDNSTSKAILSWKMYADFYDESYEVYISTSPDKDTFVDRIYGGTVPKGDHSQQQAEALLEGYQGKTIYIAFRHNTPGENKWNLALLDLKIVTFPYDDADLQADKLWLTYPNFVESGSTRSTGTLYPPGLNLNVNIAVTNFGLGLRNETLTFKYEYDDEVITEDVAGVYLPNGGTYVHTFKKKLLTKKGATTIRPITAMVKPLTGETRIKKNSRYVDITHLIGDPEYHIFYEKHSKLACIPCGEAFYVFDDMEKLYPNRTLGVTVMKDNGLDLTDNSLSTAYHSMIMSISETYGTPAICYDRKGIVSKAPQLGDFKKHMTNGLFVDRMFPPFAIQVTHDFSDDGTTMYAHLKVTCLLDQENVDLGLSAIIVEDNIKEYPNQLQVPNAVHNHIVRTILGDDMRLGLRGVIPSRTKAGETYTHTFEYAVPGKIGKHTLDQNQLYAVGFIIKEDKTILNTNKSTKTAAVTKKKR